MQTVRYSFKISNFSVTMTMRFYEQKLADSKAEEKPTKAEKEIFTKVYKQ